LATGLVLYFKQYEAQTGADDGQYTSDAKIVAVLGYFRRSSCYQVLSLQYFCDPLWGCVKRQSRVRMMFAAGYKDLG